MLKPRSTYREKPKHVGAPVALPALQETTELFAELIPVGTAKEHYPLLALYATLAILALLGRTVKAALRRPVLQMAIALLVKGRAPSTESTAGVVVWTLNLQTALVPLPMKWTAPCIPLLVLETGALSLSRTYSDPLDIQVWPKHALQLPIQIHSMLQKLEFLKWTTRFRWVKDILSLLTESLILLRQIPPMMTVPPRVLDEKQLLLEPYVASARVIMITFNAKKEATPPTTAHCHQPNNRSRAILCLLKLHVMAMRPLPILALRHGPPVRLMDDMGSPRSSVAVAVMEVSVVLAQPLSTLQMMSLKGALLAMPLVTLQSVPWHRPPTQPTTLRRRQQVWCM